MLFHPEVLLPKQAVLLAGTGSLSRKWGAYLAGGAAAALQLGHRRSVDFDWFTRKTLPPEQVLEDVQSLRLPVDVRQNNEGTFLAQVGGVDFSVFRYPYELVGKPVSFEGCELAPLNDIAAMKMTAIVQRAVKRDYVDLHVLFSTGRLSLTEVVSTMTRKFPDLTHRWRFEHWDTFRTSRSRRCQTCSRRSPGRTSSEAWRPCATEASAEEGFRAESAQPAGADSDGDVKYPRARQDP